MNAPLPTVAGVAPSSRWLPPGNWKTILEFLTAQYPEVAVETWTTRMAKGQVIDECGRPVNPETLYQAGACIFYYRELEKETSIPFVEQVLFRDEHILVADKPHFLPVIPSGKFLHQTLLVRLRNSYNFQSIVPVHRLDRETAGVVLFSVNSKTRGDYTALFRERKVMKVYEALAPTIDASRLPTIRRSRIVQGHPFFRMKEVAGVANSETHILHQRTVAHHSNYRLIPHTGKKHQLRLHLAGLGIPIINDKLYPDVTRSDEDDFSRPLKLLAKSLAFRDPISGQQHYFESSQDLSDML